MKILKRIDEYVEGESPKMTKKHFVSLAKLMKSSKTIDNLKDNLFNWIKSSNSDFDEERFKKAAGI